MCTLLLVGILDSTQTWQILHAIARASESVPRGLVRVLGVVYFDDNGSFRFVAILT